MKKTNQTSPVRIYIFSLSLLIALSLFFYYPIRSLFGHKVYEGFGITIPSNFFIHGIDVSHYQSAINWQDVKQMEYQHVKIDFSFIKATEGSDIVDENFQRNWSEAKSAGIITGAYHFFYAGSSGYAQAKNFIAAVDLAKNDLPPVLDIEQTNETDLDSLQIEIRAWLITVQAAYHVRPIIYTNVDFYEDCLAGKFDDYPLWIANYDASENKPDIDQDWIFWQHSKRGHVNGIGGYVDFNVFNGDSAAFRSLLIK